MSKLRRNKVNGDGIQDIPTNGKIKLNKGKVMSHGEFLNRIQRSLYYGKAKMSVPLSDFIADTFSDTHNGYSLNRLNYSTVAQLRSTPCSLILAMIYLERLKDADPAYTKHITPTELFLVSMMVATKFYSGHDDDAPYVNWIECLNTTSDNLLQMELSFLNAIDWKVYVSNGDFFEKVKSLEISLAQQQGSRRGFYTYVELSSVMPSVQIARQFLHDFLILGLSYTVFVATMVVSVILASHIPGTALNASSRIYTGQLTSGNSDSQIVETRNTLPQSKNELVELEENLIEPESDLNVILHRYNGTSDALITNKQPIQFSSWYSLLKIDSFKWPVIANDLESDIDCDCSMNATFCRMNLLSPPRFAERFRFEFNQMKMKWA